MTHRSFHIAFLLPLVCWLFAAAPPSKTLATENGGSTYSNGASFFGVAYLPSPGLYLVNFSGYYSAHAFMLEGGKSLSVFKASYVTNAFRFLYVAPGRVFGAKTAYLLNVPLVNLNLVSPKGAQHKYGIGDITIDPLSLGWQQKNVSYLATVDLVFPTGDFNGNDVANIGRNYFAARPLICLTYTGLGPTVVSLKVMYDINGSNPATHYRSGNEFHFDYAIGYRSRRSSYGIGGYFYLQTQADSRNGIIVGSNGFKGQVFAIGPEAFFALKHGSVILAYQHESAAQNRAQGQRYWLVATIKL